MEASSADEAGRGRGPPETGWIQERAVCFGLKAREPDLSGVNRESCTLAVRR
jgi:hypothetical protein